MKDWNQRKLSARKIRLAFPLPSGIIPLSRTTHLADITVTGSDRRMRLTMRRCFALLPGVLGFALAGCRTDPAAGPGVPPLPPLDLAAVPVAAQAPVRPRPAATPPPEPGQFGKRLEVPPEIPGAEAAPIRVPLREPGREAERDRIISELYGNLPSLPADPVPIQGPRLDLAELQQKALALHPTIRQAASAVESARGAAIQAGLPPNPSFGFEADTIGSGGTAGQQGAKYEQLIKTAGKLKLAQEAALMDVVNAQVALKRAQIDLAAQVRGAYFSVLVAEEELRLNHALTRFAEAIYRVQVDQLRSAQAAPFEPLALRALAEQARLALATARNHYQAAWRQLAAAVGDPDLGPTPLAGSAAMADPGYDYDALRARILSQHTDLTTVANSILKARYTLRLQEVTPIPDVSLKLVVQKDYTTPPFATTANIEVGVPIPVWDRNQGAIQQARADLARAIDDLPRTRLDLLNRLADAVNRYDTNRQTVDIYLKQILPDQVRAYRGLVQQAQPSFADIVNAQQQLNTFLATYLTALAAQWQAVVDLAALAQLDDLYMPGDGRAPVCGPPMPELRVLPDPAPVPPVGPAHVLPPPTEGSVWKTIAR
jgi:cobalt-zinc-cadmium efflux system outer membrane protein